MTTERTEQAPTLAELAEAAKRAEAAFCAVMSEGMQLSYRVHRDWFYLTFSDGLAPAEGRQAARQSLAEGHRLMEACLTRFDETAAAQRAAQQAYRKAKRQQERQEPSATNAQHPPAASRWR
jgi:hypothetical protein